MFNLDLEKAEEPETKLPTSVGSLKKQENSRKTSTSASVCYSKAFSCVDHNNLWKILKEIGIPAILPASWEICMQVKKQQFETYMEQRTGSKLGKKYNKAIYCHPIYLTYIQSTSHKMMVWLNHKLESRLWEKYQQPQIRRWYHSDGSQRRGTKEPLDKGEKGEWKNLA